jgi:hypothetical protein
MNRLVERPHVMPCHPNAEDVVGQKKGANNYVSIPDLAWLVAELA